MPLQCGSVCRVASSKTNTKMWLCCSSRALLLLVFLCWLPSFETFRVTPSLASGWLIIPSTRKGTRAGNVKMMVSSSSVSPGGKDSSLPRKSQGFIISPTLSSQESEMLILQNFNQIQQGESKKMGIIGTQELSENHRLMVELLSYALVLSGNHIYTSGGGNGTNIAVIRGALRACNPDLLTVILPQSLPRQPADMQPLLMRVVNLIQQPEYDDLDLKTAATLCNEKILSYVDKLLVFAYHESQTVLKAAESVKNNMDVTIFYLD